MNGQQEIHYDDVLRSRNPRAALNKMELLAAILIRRHRKNNPAPVALVIERTGMSNRGARNMIRDLVVHHYLPIGSSSAGDHPGYYWISDPQELEAAAQSLISRGVSTIVRGSKLLNMNKAQIVGQIEAALEDR